MKYTLIIKNDQVVKYPRAHALACPFGPNFFLNSLITIPIQNAIIKNRMTNKTFGYLNPGAYLYLLLCTFPLISIQAIQTTIINHDKTVPRMYGNVVVDWKYPRSILVKVLNRQFDQCVCVQLLLSICFC